MEDRAAGLIAARRAPRAGGAAQGGVAGGVAIPARIGPVEFGALGGMIAVHWQAGMDLDEDPGRTQLCADAPVTLAVASFVAEAMNLAPEVPAIPCVGVIETAAEKLVSLTRRTAMDLAGASRDPDPALVRHIYDSTICT